MRNITFKTLAKSVGEYNDLGQLLDCKSLFNRLVIKSIIEEDSAFIDFEDILSINELVDLMILAMSETKHGDLKEPELHRLYFSYDQELKCYKFLVYAMIGKRLVTEHENILKLMDLTTLLFLGLQDFRDAHSLPSLFNRFGKAPNQEFIKMEHP